MALRQRHAPRLSVRARRALRPRGANSRRSLFPQAHAKHGSTAAACPAPVDSGSKSLAPSRRKLPSPAPSHRRTHVTTYGNGMSCVCRFGLEEPCAPAAQTPVSCSFPQAHAKHGSTAAACPASVGSGSKSLAPSRRKLPSFACSGAIRL